MINFSQKELSFKGEKVMTKTLKTWQEYVDMNKQEIGMTLASEDTGLNNQAVAIFSVKQQDVEVSVYKVTD
jgi:hypothetical protein